MQIPANNVQIATLAGFVSILIEHLCSSNGVVIPPDISAGLPAVVAVIVAHIADCITGDTKKP